jgi:hypothetical protein
VLALIIYTGDHIIRTLEPVRKEEMPKAILVRVLYTPGCPNLTPTISLIEKVGRELGIAVAMERVEVSSQEQAVELRCLGSPTIQINGIDIEPAARGSLKFGLG